MGALDPSSGAPCIEIDSQVNKNIVNKQVVLIDNPKRGAIYELFKAYSHERWTITK